MKVRHKNQLAAMFAISLTLSAAAQSVPPLINYQGRLTDPSGAPLANGNYSLEFRLWDSPTGTNLIWGQRQNVAVQANGVFNVILGAPGGSAIPGATPAVNDLAFAFTASNRYLGVTVVSTNGVALDSPVEIAPRQQFLSVPFALMSQQVANGAIGSHQIANGAVGNQQIAQAGILTTNLGAGIVTLTNLAARPTGTNVGIGGIALSATVTNSTYSSTSEFDIPELVVTIQTSGRPVFLQLVPGSPASSSYVRGNGPDVRFSMKLLRVDGDTTVTVAVQTGGDGQQTDVYYPVTAFGFFDLSPAGTHTYKIQGNQIGRDFWYIRNARLLAYEL